MIEKITRKVDEAVLEKFRNMPCDICGRQPPGDPSHIRSRGAGGPDEDWNLVAMCRECHTQWHHFGWATFCRRRPIASFVLMKKGWEMENQRLFHPKLAEGR